MRTFWLTDKVPNKEKSPNLIEVIEQISQETQTNNKDGKFDLIQDIQLETRQHHSIIRRLDYVIEERK